MERVVIKIVLCEFLPKSKLCKFIKEWCNTYLFKSADLCAIINNKQLYINKMKSKKLLLNIVAGVTLLILFPKVNFGHAPNLGTAANFVLFSSNNDFNNN